MYPIRALTTSVFSSAVSVTSPPLVLQAQPVTLSQAKLEVAVNAEDRYPEGGETNTWNESCDTVAVSCKLGRSTLMVTWAAVPLCVTDKTLDPTVTDAVRAAKEE